MVIGGGVGVGVGVMVGVGVGSGVETPHAGPRATNPSAKAANKSDRILDIVVVVPPFWCDLATSITASAGIVNHRQIALNAIEPALKEPNCRGRRLGARPKCQYNVNV